MDKIVKIVCFPFDYMFIGLVWVYKIFVSPFKPKTCVFVPTCSIYMIQAIKEFHFIKGILLGIKRLLKCNPKNKGGFDPFPPNIKGDSKWIL